MAVRVIKVVEDNTAPTIDLTLEREGVAIDLTDADVDLIISDGSSITNTGHQACTVTDADTGEVSYQPEAGDFPTAGSYKGDIKITYADTTYEILYEQLKVKARAKLT